MKKLFITGGHLAPAKAVIEEICDTKPDWKIIFIGRQYEFEGSGVPSKEKEVISSMGIEFVNITAGRLQRSFSKHTFSSLAKFPIGFFQALRVCNKEHPDVVVSFGGYVALPVVLAAFVCHVPVITHEQTRVVGLANRIIGFFAKKICLSFPDIDHTFAPGKTMVTGLPMRKELFNVKLFAPFRANIATHPLLYITGGTTGSVSLNELVFPIIQALVRQYTVVHQTGKASVATAEHIQALLPVDAQRRYITGDYFDERTVGWLLRNALLVVGRSGANTVTELAFFGTNALLIPLPWAGRNEQLKNAQWLASFGNASIIHQASVTPQALLSAIYSSVKKNDTKPRSKSVRIDGAKLFVSEIQSVFQR